MAYETPLTGGNASDAVVRVGNTVRKPWQATTEHTVAYMLARPQRGIDIPEPRGRDEQGRLILDFVPGRLAMHDAPLDVEVIRAAGAAVRTIHDASAGLSIPDDWEVLLPADEPDLLCHNDLAGRLAAFADGYRADHGLRSALPATMTERAAAMHELLRRSHESGREPWGSMYLEGHGEHWLATTEFIDEHIRDWQGAVASTSTY